MLYDFQLTTLDLEPTRRCNLNCHYCYLGEKGAGTMTDEDIVAAIAFFKKYRQQTAHIDFYGGEPTVAFDKVKFIVELAEKEIPGITFNMVTNGTNHSEDIVQFCREHKIRPTRSLDGCPSAMEYSRPNIMDKFRVGMEKFQDHARVMRSTVVPQAAKHFWESFEFFHKDLGYQKGWTPIPNYYEEWSDEQKQDFVRGMELVAEEFVRDIRDGKRPFYFYWFDREYRRLMPGAAPVTQKSGGIGCAAGRSTACVSWDGFVYPCHRFSNEPHDSDFCAGSVHDVLSGTAKGYGPLYHERMEFVKAGIKPAGCEGCVARQGCAMGCMHTNWYMSPEKHPNYPEPLECHFRREASRIVDWIDAQLKASDPNWVVKVVGGGQQQPQQKPQQRQMVAQPQQCKCKAQPAFLHEAPGANFLMTRANTLINLDTVSQLKIVPNGSIGFVVATDQNVPVSRTFSTIDEARKVLVDFAKSGDPAFFATA